MNIDICFARQGVQYPSMIYDIYTNYSVAKEVFDLANTTLKRDIAEICFHGTEAELNFTRNTQPCVLAEIKINKPSINLHMNVDGCSVEDTETIRANLIRRLVKPFL